MDAAYAPYVNYLLAGQVLETAYILAHDGTILGTNLPIKTMPVYNFELENEDGSKTPMVVDEKAILLETLNNKGVAKAKCGIRLYNQKYLPCRYDEASQLCYLKKSGGGACIAKTGKLILVGTFNAALKMENGVAQNPGECNKRVETLADTLRKQGY